MKKLMTIVALCMATCTLWAQNEVSLVVSGEGKDKEEATLKALRSAIEQAYGTFVSANTTVLNDQLVADEIVSLSSGNIQKYEYVSETKMPDGSIFVTLSATVSIDKLVSFAESKGMEAELKGSLFAMNIKKMEFDKQAEEKAVENLCKQLEEMLPTLFDYEIILGEPRLKDERVIINTKIEVSVNGNFDQFIRYLIRNLSFISLSSNEKVCSAVRCGTVYKFPIASVLHCAIKQAFPNNPYVFFSDGSDPYAVGIIDIGYGSRRCFFRNKKDVNRFDEWCNELSISYSKYYDKSYRVQPFCMRSEKSVQMLMQTIYLHLISSMYKVVVIDDIGKYELSSKYFLKNYNNIRDLEVECSEEGILYNISCKELWVEYNGTETSNFRRLQLEPAYRLDAPFLNVLNTLWDKNDQYHYPLYFGQLIYGKDEISNIQKITVQGGDDIVKTNN